MEKNEKITKRIPRPKGVTQAAINSNNEAVRSRLIKAYLNGTFPQDSYKISKYQFSELYGIPIEAIDKQIMHGIADNMLDDKDLVSALEQERLKAFSQSLFRIGATDRRLEQLLAYVTSKAYNLAKPNALLLKEINAALGNSIRLTETHLKAIVLMNQALLSVDTGSGQVIEDHLTREQVLKALEDIQLDPKSLASHVDGTPELAPPGLEQTKKARRLDKVASHDWNPDLNVADPRKLESFIIPPV